MTKRSLKESLGEIQKLKQISDSELFPKLIVLISKDEYLILKSVASIKDHCLKWEGCEVNVLEANDSKNMDFTELANQPGIFDSPQVTIVKCNSKLPKNLKDMPANIIEFPDLKDEDIRFLFQGIIKRAKLQFEEGVISQMLNAIGDNLFELENEITKLALIFHEHKNPITYEEVSPHLNILREDHVFKLTNLLLDKQNAQASLLIRNLLEHGESGIPILGVISRHCRQAININNAALKGLSEWDMARQLRLPIHVVKSYTGYVKKKGPNALFQVLDECRDVDKLSKTSRYNWELALTRIVDAL